ncbi:cell division protein FtsQ [Limnohabitans sp. 2KL-1]|jgi:cell division protein FtsQ|nr:cell division protein FtsQ [Limnohabitans sp. 2KL-1]
MKNAMPVPADIRLMNLASALLMLAFMLLAFGSWAWWLLRHPAFALQAIAVQGEVSRNNELTLRTHVMPQLQGNFFTIDLDQTREAFEAVPWVRTAVVHREFPNRLRAVLQEHHPVALWGEEGANTMVNQQGQVFEANVDDIDVERLPRMKGAVAESLTVTSMYRALSPRFAAMDMDIDLIELTPRGSWRVWTQSGARIELGRGSATDLTERLNMFFKTLSQVTSRYGRTATVLAGADLRHKDGYALRLHGVSTVESDTKKKP